MRFKKSYILPSLLLPVYAAEYYKSVDEAVKVHSDEVMWKPKLYTFQGGLLMAIQFLKCKACSKPQRSDRLLCLSCGANIQTGVHPNTKIEEPLDSAPSAPHPQQHFSGSLLPKNNTQWAIIWVIVVAVLLSVFSGFLIYMEASMMFVAPGERPSTLFVVITFTIGWAAATFKSIAIQSS